MDDKDIVSAVLFSLADKVGQDRFELWFGAQARLTIGAATATIEVPNRFSQDWLRRNFRREIESACCEVLGRPIAVEFRIDPSLEGKTSARAHVSQSVQATFDFAEADDRSGCATAVLEPRRAVTQILQEAVRPQPRALARKFATFETYEVGMANRLAFTAAEDAIRQPGRINPLLVFGSTGTGKTHLLEGIWSETKRRHRHLHAVYVTAEQFTSAFTEALRATGLPNFRQKYRSVDLLILDDIQFFAGKPATLVELLHTFDALVQRGRQVVASANCRPAKLHGLGQELCSRFTSGMTAELGLPDYASRLGIVRRRAALLGLQLPDDVQHFVATQFTEHARPLIGALNRLHAVSKIRAETITRAVAEEALAELCQQHNRLVQLKDIEHAVCEEFNLESSSLQSRRRLQALNAPRMLAMWLARKHTRAALKEIGQYFGRRSHSTVIAAEKTVGHWVSDQTVVGVAQKKFIAEDAIRQIEARIRAG